MEKPKGTSQSDIARIQGWVKETIEQHPDIARSHTAVTQLVGLVMSKFKGGMGPIELRPLVTVALYGDNAVQPYLNACLEQLASLYDFCIGNELLNERIQLAEAAIEKLGSDLS